ncbi:hypothetical protein N7535_003996 [Penicillium sp. DV-2018c]|nr:hypothetical protein N7461_000303 [Penicillium sp. DV-2018c]KAJ5577070.1 hypothetical protein N7535_003996 [Penicillium sp. DV-2018c]
METFNHINLRIRKVNNEELLKAIRGEKIPRALADKHTRQCVIRGIRYHHGFGTELRGLLPEFNRALNARCIMSNEIPDMNPDCPEDFPYCIWHPETASEETYRELAQRYPNMKYLVGRACAVAGYTDLFFELNLLPECHIAEEARESGHLQIYDAIMKSAVKYNAMNDYTLEVFAPVPGNLNADTCIRAWLDIRYGIAKGPKTIYLGIHWAMDRNGCCITEDRRLNEYDTHPDFLDTPFEINGEEVLSLLYNPLPNDLPTLHKDLLILVAAFYGDIDRYARLRRPCIVSSEYGCLVRGIYNNTVFAKWLSLQTDERYDARLLKAAITARFIMNGDLSRITPETPTDELPYCIWYPTIPRESVLRELHRRRPDMKPAIARACILANYQDTYDLLDVDPDTVIMQDARDSPNPHYLQDMEAKIPQRGCKTRENDVPRRFEMFEHPADSLPCTFGDERPQRGGDGIVYDGVVANFSRLQLGLSVPDTFRKQIMDDGNDVNVDRYYESLAA